MTEEKQLNEEQPKNKKESKPAIAKAGEKTKPKEVLEVTKEFTIPLRKEFLKVPRYKRAKRAIKAIRNFLIRHMKIRDKDPRKIKIDVNLNNEIWYRGIKKPPSKIKVIATKIGENVKVRLAKIPPIIKFKIAREERRKLKSQEHKKKEKGAKEEKIEEKKTDEKEKVLIETEPKIQRAGGKEYKQTIKEKGRKTSIQRKAMKK